MSEIHQMFATMMTKLEKLDGIESDMKEIKLSLEYAHAEIANLKKENEKIKTDQNKGKERIQKLEEDNKVLRSKIIDLQARSMRDNLLFFNIPENERENTTDIVHKILEKMKIRDAQNTVRIDRSHRIGKKREGNRKPRPTVVNFYQDREYVRTHARKLKGTNICSICSRIIRDKQKFIECLTCGRWFHAVPSCMKSFDTNVIAKKIN